MDRWQNAVCREKGQRRGQQSEQVVSEINTHLWSLWIWNVVAIGGLKGSFITKQKWIKLSLVECLVCFTESLKDVGDLAGKSTGLVKQDLHGWETVGRALYNGIFVKIWVDPTQKVIQGCLTGLFPRDYGKQTNVLCWQEWSLCDLWWRWWSFGLGLERAGWGYGISVGFWILPQARGFLAFFQN